MRVFIFPLVESKPAFDQEGAALAHILRDDFSLPAEGVNIDKSGFFLRFAGFGFPGAINGQANAGNGRALGILPRSTTDAITRIDGAALGGR